MDQVCCRWIMHQLPRFIELKGQKIQNELALDNPMSADVFDIAVRRIKQLDEAMYPTDIPLRWRHIFESDFSTHVLAEENPLQNFAVREQFVGDTINYELCRCRMLFVPVHRYGSWWCYAWDMKKNIVFIIDPLVSVEKDEHVVRKHGGTIDMLKNSLTHIICECFNGWVPTFNDCKVAVFHAAGMACTRHISGLVTLFCMRNFDGERLHEQLSEVNIKLFKEYILHEVLDLDENSAKLPAAYVHFID